MTRNNGKVRKAERRAKAEQRKLTITTTETLYELGPNRLIRIYDDADTQYLNSLNFQDD